MGLLLARLHWNISRTKNTRLWSWWHRCSLSFISKTLHRVEGMLAPPWFNVPLFSLCSPPCCSFRRFIKCSRWNYTKGIGLELGVGIACDAPRNNLQSQQFTCISMMSSLSDCLRLGDLVAAGRYQIMVWSTFTKPNSFPPSTSILLDESPGQRLHRHCLRCSLPAHTAVCRRRGGRTIGKCGAGWFRHSFTPVFAEMFLLKKNYIIIPAEMYSMLSSQLKSRMPAEIDPCIGYPHVVPAIAQLGHLTVDPGGGIVLPPLQPPATSTDTVSGAVCRPIPLSANGGEAGPLENVGRDDLGTVLHQSLLRCSCSKNALNHPGTIFSMLGSQLMSRMSAERNPCRRHPHVIPAIAQLVRHLTVDCAEIRWSLARSGWRKKPRLPPATSAGSGTASWTSAGNSTLNTFLRRDD